MKGSILHLIYPYAVNIVFHIFSELRKWGNKAILKVGSNVLALLVVNKCYQDIIAA